LGKRRAVEKINYGDNPIDSKYTNLDRRAIHIHGEMEHNLTEYAKCYSCGSIEFLRSNEFTREIDHNRKDFGKQMLKTNNILSLGQ
jgi:hypothetical protein